ncbi:FAD-binding oxidoreductase [Sedimentibacter sp.]|uniref:FAD-dependent oxidoreductase n=1 Tax=Sedimentibacter sp. TaxID=1960295 RepID=UPI0028A16206|nr:FAD-binding oxidoreductase [Sedimentibacter sp.]
MDEFLEGLTGEIVLPFDFSYNELRQGYNSAVQKYPFVIVYCFMICDVSNAVKWARRHSMPVRIRSGGHNYEGYSNGSCTLVIDLSCMNNIVIDECEELIYIEGGATNKDVYEFVSSKGYPFPGGTCPAVGVSGYSLGGGWGLSCRYLGLGCDSLTEIELVDFEGEIIRANSNCNADLFWAVRGAGGGNFGVIVSMTFRLPEPVDKVTLIEIDYLNVDSEDQENFLILWQAWLNNADDRMTLISRIYNSEADGLAMLVRGIFYGDPAEAKIILKDFLMLNNAIYSVEEVTFLEAVTIIGSTYPEHEKFKSASRFVLKDFNNNEIKNVVNLIRNRAEGSVYAGLSMYALGGRVSDIDIDDTAFYFRNAKYIIWLETVWEENEYAEENKSWIKNRFPYLKSITTGSYINFPYIELDNYLKEYFGCHKEKLKYIKEKYDPLNIFSFPQGIEPSNNECCPVLYKPTLFNKENLWNADNNINHREFRYVSKK